MLKRFRIIPFLIGTAIGYAIIKWYKSPPQIIYDYPHPNNVKDRVYSDKAGVCYSYTSVEVDCDKNEGTLQPYPLQS
jgi:hypothetical protein